MLTKDFNALDNDYITLKSGYMLDHNTDKYLSSIVVLAEKGQINAIQDYYYYKNPNEPSNAKIASHILNSICSSDFEKMFALSQYLKYELNKTPEEMLRIGVKNQDDAYRMAIVREKRILKRGLVEIQNAFFSGDPCAVLCVRFAEVTAEIARQTRDEVATMGSAGDYLNELILESDEVACGANSYASNKLRQEFVLDNMRSSAYEFAYSTFMKKRNPDVAQNFKKFASRPLSTQIENT